jgi:hypothetical protein
MRAITLAVCLFGLAALACGPATPDPVAPGDPAEVGGEPATAGSQGESGLQTPAEPPPGDGTAIGTAGPPQDQGGGADQDGDGLPDAGDRCPAAPEDRDGFEDGDGCPDPDNDQDGLSDVDDLCPADTEDRDGFQDEDGCPDP